MMPASPLRRRGPSRRGGALLGACAALTLLQPGCQRRREDQPAAAPGEHRRPAAAPRRDAPRARPAPPLPPCPSALPDAIRASLAAAPRRGSDGYRPPEAATSGHLAAAIRGALSPTPGAAAAPARAAGYRACRRQEAVLLLPPPGGALVALRPGSARPLVVSVPHPLHEAGTAEQGQLAFARWRARALVMGGAHRCASQARSPCAGRTKVCGGGSRPFRISDAGHTVSGLFHRAHVALLSHQPGLVVISLHGMKGAGISLSNGTRQAVDATSLIARAARSLSRALPAERITACQAGAGVDTEERYCGRTNVQGRLANGSPRPCRRRASQASGRFLHLEQSATLRRQAALIVDALGKALP